MTADVIEVPADTWAPVPMRWALVREGDIVLGPDGSPWSIAAAGEQLGDVLVTLARGRQSFERQSSPDELVNVLIPLVEREAVLALREAGLGPRLIDRPRT